MNTQVKTFQERINHIISMNCTLTRAEVYECLKKSEPESLNVDAKQRSMWDEIVKRSLDERYRLTLSQAKKIVAEALFARDISYTKLKAKTVDFTDMARCEMIFVTVIGATTPDVRLIAIDEVVKKHGFRVQYDGGTFVRG